MTDPLHVLTDAELAIANGAAAADVCREMIRVLRDQIAEHVQTVEAAGEYYSSFSAWKLLAEADRLLSMATELAAGAILSERQILHADAATH